MASRSKRVTPVRRPRISESDAEMLLEKCSGEFGHLLPILIGALDAKLRLSEMEALKWSETDTANRVITIYDSKTVAPRKIQMSDRLVAEFPARTGELVFNVNRNFRRQFRELAKATGLPDLRIHDLRYVGL